MTTRLKLMPGQKGTKKLVDMYGDSLVCVRYRYDAETGTRIKTAEIIVERKKWSPPAPKHSVEVVPVKLHFTDTRCKDMAVAAGGRWDAAAKVWLVPYEKIKGTELEKHIILDASLSKKSTKSI